MSHRLPRAVQTAMQTAVMAGALAGCAQPGTLQHHQTTHAAGHTAVTLHPAATLAEKGGEVRGGQQDTERRASEQSKAPLVRRSLQPWIAGLTTPMPDAGPDALPAVFQEPIRLEFADRVTYRVAADRIAAVTGLPVRVRPDVMDPHRGASAPAGATAPALLVPMRWNASLASYLDHVTELHGLSWQYRDGAIVIERLRTEYFDLAAPDGEALFALGMSASDSATASTSSSTSGGSAGGNNATSNTTAEVRYRGTTNTVTGILNAVRQLIRDVPGSEVVRADGSGRIAVTTSREAMTKVREFIRAENEVLSRQAQIELDIFSVRRNESDERGIDWETVIRVASRAWGLAIASPSSTLSANAGTITWSIFDANTSPGSSAARRFGGSSAILALLNEYGATTEHRPVSLVTRNRQWVTNGALQSRGYLAEVTPGTATSNGVGIPGLKTATITTGDRYMVQPTLLADGSILLRLAISLSSLTRMSTVGSGTGATQQTVQTPESAAMTHQAELVLRPGQVTLIAGVSRYVAADDRRTLTEDAPVGLGGSRRSTRDREDFLILVRPTVF